MFIFPNLDTAVANYKFLKVWPERGLVHIEDMRTGGYQSIQVREMLYRLRALSEMVRETRKDPEFRKKKSKEVLGEIEELQRAILELEGVCRKAQEQGMPSDPSAVRDLIRRKACSIQVPGKPAAGRHLKTTF